MWFSASDGGFMQEQENGATPQPQKYPTMVIQPAPHGVVVLIVDSPFESHTTLIPVENADRMCIDWLATRPPAVLEALKQVRRQVNAQRETLAAAVRNPYAIPRGSKGN
jgi:hypothetical protein